MRKEINETRFSSLQQNLLDCGCWDVGLEHYWWLVDYSQHSYFRAKRGTCAFEWQRELGHFREKVWEREREIVWTKVHEIQRLRQMKEKRKLPGLTLFIQVIPFSLRQQRSDYSPLQQTCSFYETEVNNYWSCFFLKGIVNRKMTINLLPLIPLSNPYAVIFLMFLNLRIFTHLQFIVTKKIFLKSCSYKLFSMF